MYQTQNSMQNPMNINDQIIATDLLNAVKTSIKESAVALTETATPEVHRTLEQQLSQSLRFHEQVTQYMMQKGWYKPYDVQQMVQSDVQQSQQMQQNILQQMQYQQQSPQYQQQLQQQRQQQQQSPQYQQQYPLR